MGDQSDVTEWSTVETLDAGGESSAESEASVEEGVSAEGSSESEANQSTSAPEPPELSAGLSREEAMALQESFEPSEQERIEETVVELLDLLGKAHAMAVLSEFAFAEEPLRFSDLESSLEIAPNTLSARLEELTEAGLLDRESYDEVPPRVEYTPTEKAEALFPAFAHLHHWAIDYRL